ncbi:hypothetical protein, partial [Winslowiella toletana]|uniref:hypothetical protein n=1 Tax=Winslowiella toletana TaxID=92490 RepID=UPI0019D6F42C
ESRELPGINLTEKPHTKVWGFFVSVISGRAAINDILSHKKALARRPGLDANPAYKSVDYLREERTGTL